MAIIRAHFHHVVDTVESVAVVVANIRFADTIVAIGQQSAVARLCQSRNAIRHFARGVIKDNDGVGIVHLVGLTNKDAEVLHLSVAGYGESCRSLTNAAHFEVAALLRNLSVGGCDSGERGRIVEAIAVDDVTHRWSGEGVSARYGIGEQEALAVG